MTQRTVRPALAAIALALAIPLWLGSASGCKRAAPSQHAHDEHDHAHEAEAGHDEHDHEHDHGAEVTLTADAVERYGITIAEAKPRALQPTFVAPALVAFNGDAIAHVGAPLRGRIAEMVVRMGDEVTKGQALFVIESPELGEAQADYLMRRVTRDGTAPMVDIAKAAWERGKALHEKSEGISSAEVQRREAEYQTALATQLAATAAVESAEQRLRLFGMTPQAIEALVTSKSIAPRFTITAPLAGRVVERAATIGELVGPERDALCVIADMSTLWIVAEVAEARLPEVKVGAAALVSGGTDGKRAEGHVALIAPHVDADTRTIHVRIEVPASALTLVPGMFAKAEIAILPPTEATAPVLAIPEGAIQTIEGATCVFVPVEDEADTFTVRRVAAGKRVGGYVPIKSGLADGERFVATGSFILKAELGKSAASHGH